MNQTRYPQILVDISIRVSEVTGGAPNWTLCARLHEAKMNGSKRARLSCIVIDFLFFFDISHCRMAYLWAIIHHPKETS